MASLLAHDMQPRDPYARDAPAPATAAAAASNGTRRAQDRTDNAALTNDPFKHHYKPALTKPNASQAAPAGLPTAHIADGHLGRRQNLDGTALQAAASPAAPWLLDGGPPGRRRRSEPPQASSNDLGAFFSGNLHHAERPRPMGISMVEQPSLTEHQLALRQEIADFEKQQRLNRDAARRSRSTDPPTSYFPFGNNSNRSRSTSAAVALGRIPHAMDTDRRVMDRAEQRSYALDIDHQVRERQLQQQIRQQDARDQGGVLLEGSTRPPARIWHFTDQTKWDGPPEALISKFGTGGGGAPVIDPSTGQLRAGLTTDVDPTERSIQSQHHAQYRALLDAQQQQQQQQQWHYQASRTRSPTSPPTYWPSPAQPHPIMPDARFPLPHTDVGRPDRGTATGIPSFPPPVVQPSPPPRHPVDMQRPAVLAPPAGTVWRSKEQYLAEQRNADDMLRQAAAAAMAGRGPDPGTNFFAGDPSRLHRRGPRARASSASEHDARHDFRHVTSEVVAYQDAIIRQQIWNGAPRGRAGAPAAPSPRRGVEPGPTAPPKDGQAQ
ncbi:hypothetical protein GGF32_001446 [Allomyces javanicus]|nr:hypothetical protein GGF32_001446 [Allomyces javanicus]